MIETKIVRPVRWTGTEWVAVQPDGQILRSFSAAVLEQLLDAAENERRQRPRHRTGTRRRKRDWQWKFWGR